MYNQILPLNNSQGQLESPRHQSRIEMIDVTQFNESPLKKAQTTSLDRNPVDQEQLRGYLKMNHPTHDHELHDCSSCCEVESGCNCCFTVDLQSDLHQYGVGVTIYFRFLKQIAAYFALFAFLSIPQLFFSIQSGLESYSQLSFNQALMMTTIASLSLEGDSCMRLSWDEVLANDVILLKDASNLQKTSFKCRTGVISQNLFVIGFMSNDGSTPCDYQDPSSAVISCLDSTNYNVLLNSCANQAQCEFLLQSNLFTISSECSAYMNSDYSVYAYSYCQDSTVSIGSQSIMSKTLALICGCADILIVVASAFLIFTLSKQDEETMKSIHESEIFVSSFSLEFTDLPDYTPADLYVKMTTQIQENLKKKYPSQDQFFIVDVQFAKDNEFIILNEKKQLISQKRNILVKKVEIIFNLKVVTSLDLKMNMAASTLEPHSEAIDANLKSKFNRAVADIQSLENEIAQIDTQLGAPKDIPDPITIAWVTFESIEQRNLAYFLFQEDFLRDLFTCCGCTDLSVLSVDGQIIRAKPAPNPEDINWEHLNKTTTQLIIRRSASLVFTLILIFATITAIIFLKYQQLSYQSDYPEINCGAYDTVTRLDVVADQNRTSGKKGLLECYCNADLINRYEEQFVEFNNRQLCSEWVNDQIKVIGWPFLIVVVIVIINSIIEFVFTKFSEFEAHRSKSKEISSRLLKVFVVQFINTALVILIINTKFSNELKATSSISVLLNGKFDDTTVQWFSQVGTTILLTLIIYLTAPICNLIYYESIRWFKKCKDTVCLDESKFTRQITQEELNQYYLGPQFNIEIKYATVLNIISVTYIYGSGLPLLYITTAIFLILTFWIDKYILLCICRTPKPTDDSAALMARKILKALLIMHTIFSIWIYGSTKLFPESTAYQQSSVTDNVLSDSLKGQTNVISEFYNRALTSQSLGLFVALIILVIAYILWPLIISPVLKTVFFFCYSEQTIFSQIQTSVFSIRESIYEFYTRNHLQQIISLFKQDISRERNNEDYQKLKSERIRRLDRCKPNTRLNINGLPSYEILTNSKYEQFQHLI